MPLAREQKDWLIRKMGFDPATHDTDEEGTRVFKKTVVPDPSTTPETFIPTKTEAATPSMFESARRAATESFLPTAASLGTAAGALALFPEPGITKIGAAVLGSIAAGIGTHAAQKKLVPAETQAALFTRPEDYATNPYTTIIAGQVPSWLALRPSFKDIPDLLSGIKALPGVATKGAAALTTPQQAALLNAGVSALPSAGIYGYDVLSGNRQFSLGEAAAEILPGLLQTRATDFLGKKLGFTDPTSTAELLQQQKAVDAMNALRGRTTENLVPAEPPAPRIRGLIPEESESTLQERRRQDLLAADDVVVPKGRAETRRILEEQKAEAEYQKQRESKIRKAAFKRAEAEANIALEKARAVELEVEALKQQNEARKIDLATGLKRGYGEELPVAERLQQRIEAPRLTQPELRPADINIGKDLNAAKQQKKFMAEQQRPLTEAEQIQEDYDTGRRSAEKSDLPAFDNRPIASLKPEERRRLRAVAEREAKLRRQKVEYVPTLKNSRGQDIMGQYDPKTRVVKLNTTRYAGDIPSHEVAHGRILDLLESSSKADKDLVLRGLEFSDEQGRKFRTVEDYKKLSAREQIDIEERFAQSVGPEGYRRTLLELYGKKREKFMEWFRQVKNHFKVKTGTAGSEELMQHFIERQRGDAPDILRRELSGVGEGRSVTEDRSAEQSNLPPAPSEKSSRIIRGIEEQLGESSFRAAKEAETFQRKLRQAEDVTAEFVENQLRDVLTRNIPELKQDPEGADQIIRDYIAGESSADKYIRAKGGDELLDELDSLKENLRAQTEETIGEKERDVTEKTTKANKKSEELEAFTRTDVERNAEGSNLPPKEAVDAEDYVPFDTYRKGRLTDSDIEEIEKQKYTNEKIMESLAEDLDDYYSSPFNRNLAKKANFSRIPNADVVSYIIRKPNRTPEEETFVKSFLRQFPEQKDFADLVDFRQDKKQIEALRKDFQSLDWENLPSDIDRENFYTGDHPQLEKVLNGSTWKKLRSWVYDQDADLGRVIDFHLNYKGPSTGMFGLRYAKKSDLPSSDSIAEDPNFPAAGPLENFFSSAVKKIKNIGGETANHISKQFNKYLSLKSLYEGRYANTIVAEISSYPESSRARVDQHGREMHLNNKSDITLTPQEQALKDSIREYLINVADENTARLIRKDPNYWPAILDTHVASVWSKRPNGPEGRRFQNEWLEHAEGERDKGRITYTDTELREILDSYMASVTSGGRESSMTFGALRKAAGIGLPESLQDNNLLSRFDRYGRRVARDMAYREALELDPTMQYILRIPDPQTGKVTAEIPYLPSGKQADTNLRGAEPIQDLQAYIHNEFQNYRHPRLNAFSKLISSMFLGTATGVRDLVTTPLNLLPVIGNRNVSALGAGFTDWSQNATDSYNYNARRMNLNELEFGSAAHPDTLTKWFNIVADGFRKYSGREAAEQASRIYSWGVGKAATVAEFGRAAAGDEQARTWLQKYGNTVDNIEQYYDGSVADIPEDVINRIAKNIVDRATGTYDARGLPTYTMEGPLAPYLSLSRWSIEKANTIVDDVLKPAQQGNFAPLLSYTLGSFLTGLAIQKLNELMSSGKKSPVPTLNEAIAADSQQVRAVVNLMQLGSFAGVISQLMQTATEVMSGNKTQGLSFPLADFVSQNVGKNLADYFGALEAGEDKLQASLGLIEQVIVDSIQTMRLVSYATWNKDSIERKNAYRDIRLWEQMTGRRTPSADITRPNELIEAKEKKFKRADTAEEISETFGPAIDAVLQKAGTNPVELSRRFESLRRNNTQTFPADPMEQMAYFEYLTKTQGEEAAAQALIEFKQQQSVNKLKSGMVPRLGG